MICTSFRDFNLHIPHRRWQLVTLRIRHQLGFQSTLSSQKVTTKTYTWAEKIGISIHTFLTEGEYVLGLTEQDIMNFNPHLPHRRWHIFSYTSFFLRRFQSAPSSQKVTASPLWRPEAAGISIRTFLTEGDRNSPQHLPHSLPLSLTILYNILQQNQ